MASNSITASTTTAFDVPTLVSQLMAVERRPIDTLNKKITSYETKISSYGTLSGLVSSFQTAAKSLSSSLEQLTATASDASALSATAGSSALPGSYSLSVSQLAQAQNLVAAGQTSTSAAIGDGTATVLSFEFGTISGGTLTNGVYSGAGFTASGGSASVTIDASNNTLSGIRDAINAANVGVTASIVNDGSGTPYRLVLSANSSGASNSLRISASGGDGAVAGLLAYDASGTQNLTQTLAAQNADLTVNGIAITSASNTISEAIQGVTLTLKNTTSSAATLTVARDTTAIQAAVSGFVDAYNGLASQIKSRSAYGVDGKGGGVLAGDGALRQMQEQLSAIFNTPASGGALTRLFEVGISLQPGGAFKLDSAKLDSAVAANFGGVVSLFSSATGFATRLEAWAKSTLASGGLIDTRTKGMKSNVSSFNKEIDRLEVRMSALERKYRLEYSNLNLLLSNMNSTSAYLSQQLSSGNSR